MNCRSLLVALVLLGFSCSDSKPAKQWESTPTENAGKPGPADLSQEDAGIAARTPEKDAAAEKGPEPQVAKPDVSPDPTAKAPSPESPADKPSPDSAPQVKTVPDGEDNPKSPDETKIASGMLSPPIPVDVPVKQPGTPAGTTQPPTQPGTPEPTTAPEPSPASAAEYVPPPFQNVDETAQERRARAGMVKMLSSSYRHKLTDERVLRALGTVPRHEYMLPENRADGYKQNWFKIGHGQTITDPGMVGWMTQLLAIQPTDKVLEIGTGSGYQGSILAQLTPHVYTIEIVEPLARRTHKLLDRFGYGENVIHRKIGDGYFGWPEAGPFDKIIVTCAADHVPIPLLQQLKPGGLMVIPIGPRYQPGKLYFIAKDKDGKIHRKVLAKVDFVPMTRLKDWGKEDSRGDERSRLEREGRDLHKKED